MKKELLEIVNDQNQVTGTADRAEVYTQGWRHRAVHVLLFDETGRLLIQQRSPSKPTWPSCFDLSVGETMQPGEDFLTAAHRGLREELTITSPPALHLVHEHYSCDYQYQSYLVRGVVCLYAGRFDGTLHQDDEEVSDLEWLAPSAVTELTSQRSEQCTPWLVDDWRYTIPLLPKLYKKLGITEK